MTDFVELAQHMRVDGTELARVLLEWDSARQNNMPATAALREELRWRIANVHDTLQTIEESRELQAAKDIEHTDFSCP